MIRVLSLGAGVQSSAMLLMAEEGRFGRRPNYAIFADTGWEGLAVYSHLNRLEEVCSTPILRVKSGQIRDDALAEGTWFNSMPLHTRDASGKKGVLQRQCTHEYKIKPVRAEIRRLLNKKRGKPGPGACEMWIGISLDEAIRMRDSNREYITHRYPLVEEKLTRDDCDAYLKSHGFPAVAKSACLGCPYKSNQQWNELRQRSPEEWDDVVDFDKKIRQLPFVHGSAFLHSQAVPLEQMGGDKDQLNLFDAECEGMCGV